MLICWVWKKNKPCSKVIQDRYKIINLRFLPLQWKADYNTNEKIIKICGTDSHPKRFC